MYHKFTFSLQLRLLKIVGLLLQISMLVIKVFFLFIIISLGLHHVEFYFTLFIGRINCRSKKNR